MRIRGKIDLYATPELKEAESVIEYLKLKDVLKCRKLDARVVA